MSDVTTDATDEALVRDLIESWAAAVRRRDYAGILLNHSHDVVMFDVPPPFQSKGIEAYRKTWDLFYAWSDLPIPFDFIDLNVAAGKDVAFAFATLNCAQPGPHGGQEPLIFRLTIGLRKLDGRWTIAHEHHSVPATD
ncbi:Ketosteroid isomerase homolog [Rhizobiales bacterium GAS191]|jgi:ketosteroid isomerase-like protein|nr:Ketosteroid isomerase homolog [Rhizobiales bacterium GAS113]SEC52341.1 Ketosteroid isomerase homolog [Rhizobiales bacterium GAS191]SEC74619.1 Ketosteroid isomerase homolog [Rhizobiales bacterium GAS188]